MKIKDSEYIFYFNTLDSDSRYNFTYGKVQNDNYGQKIKLSLTNDNIPFQIVPAVIQCFVNFINEYKPNTVLFTSSEERQGKFYQKIVPFLSRRLPEPYMSGKTKYGIFIVSKSPIDLKLLAD